MDDADVFAQIDQLVAEEHRLWAKEGTGEELTPAEHDRLRQLELRLDQAWDLLRQRRARRHAGQDPESAHARGPGVVEGYQQ